MPRRNWSRAKGRVRPPRPSAVEYRPPRPAVVTKPETHEIRLCVVCAESLPRKWPHPEHAACYRTTHQAHINRQEIRS